MSQANIPNITPTITVTLDESIVMLLSSIALEEMALAHIINAEAEKVQFVLGLFDSETGSEAGTEVAQILDVNESVQKTMHDVILKEMLLLMKFESVLCLMKPERGV